MFFKKRLSHDSVSNFVILLDKMAYSPEPEEFAYVTLSLPRYCTESFRYVLSKKMVPSHLHLYRNNRSNQYT